MSLEPFYPYFVELAEGKWAEMEMLVQEYENELGAEKVKRIKSKLAAQAANSLPHSMGAANQKRKCHVNLSKPAESQALQEIGSGTEKGSESASIISSAIPNSAVVDSLTPGNDPGTSATLFSLPQSKVVDVGDHQAPPSKRQLSKKPSGSEEVRKKVRRQPEQEETGMSTLPLQKTKARTLNVADGKALGRLEKNDDAAKLQNIVRGLDEIPPIFHPSEWLAETSPKRTPYFPQIGDEVVYYRQGHAAYIFQVEQRHEYEVPRKLRKRLPYNLHPELPAAVTARVEKTGFILFPPRLIALKLTLLDEATGEYTGTTFYICYHAMTNVADFIILRQVHDKYILLNWNWNVGDRCRCLIDGSWCVGTIAGMGAKDINFPESKFQCYYVQWGNKEIRKLSPWDMDIIADPVPSSLQYEPSELDWPSHGNQKVQCGKLSRLFEQVMGLVMSEPFLTPIDFNRYPEYAFSIAYPIDLSTIRARLDNGFYRRIQVVQFDVEYIAKNTIEFNCEGSDIVKHAEIITELCKKLIANPDVPDITPIYRAVARGLSKEALERVSSQAQRNKSGNPVPSTSSRPASSSVAASTTQPQPSTSRGSRRNANHNNQPSRRIIDSNNDEPEDNRDWREKCRDLLKIIYATKDAIPFRAPVNPEAYPDYYQLIDTPMDLQSVIEDLAGEKYSSPMAFHKDMNLIFRNSRQFNTDKRSQIYNMTIRLQSMYECQVKPILTSYRRRMKSSSGSQRKRKTGSEKDGGQRSGSDNE